MQNTKENTRGRVWTFVLYQEDITYKQVCDFFREYQIPCALSPLHAGDSDEKKAHWHVVLLYAGNKTPVSLYDELGQLRKKGDWRMFQKVSSISAITRYLIHADNPEKEQFPEGKKTITTFAGYDLEKYFKSETDEARIYCEIVDFIIKNRVSFLELNKYAIYKNDDWLKVIVKRSYAISLICKQSAYGEKKDMEKDVFLNLIRELEK